MTFANGAWYEYYKNRTWGGRIPIENIIISGRRKHQHRTRGFHNNVYLEVTYIRYLSCVCRSLKITTTLFFRNSFSTVCQNTKTFSPWQKTDNNNSSNNENIFNFLRIDIYIYIYINIICASYRRTPTDYALNRKKPGEKKGKRNNRHKYWSCTYKFYAVNGIRRINTHYQGTTDVVLRVAIIVLTWPVST